MFLQDKLNQKCEELKNIGINTPSEFATTQYVDIIIEHIATNSKNVGRRVDTSIVKQAYLVWKQFCNSHDMQKISSEEDFDALTCVPIKKLIYGIESK